MNPRLVVLIGVALLGAACAKRPEELKREARLDAECRPGSVAFVYTIGKDVVGRAVSARCYAPLGAWTFESDPTAGGTRALVYQLREKDTLTLLCCPP